MTGARLADLSRASSETGHDQAPELGYSAIEASDGISGLKVLRSDVRIDLLVTDVGLPGGLNGRQMADAARANRPDLKVLFITGYAENAAIGNGPGTGHARADKTVCHGPPRRTDTVRHRGVRQRAACVAILRCDGGLRPRLSGNLEPALVPLPCSCPSRERARPNTSAEAVLAAAKMRR
jgi:CheY-like chemotaxis protein